MAEKLSFDDFKQMGKLQQVIESVGFQWDKKSGKTTPEFYRGEGPDRERIIIKNIGQPNEHYWSRTGNLAGGDVINFFKNDIKSFSNVPGVDVTVNMADRNSRDAVINLNKLISHFAGINYEMAFRSSASNTITERQPMDPNRYKTFKTETSDLGYLTESRKISPDTVEKFLPFITRVQDTQSKATYLNIGFPYKEPGKEQVTGYEIRNNGFKGMAAGTDKENSAWIATNAANSAEVKRLFFFESAIDAMSFYELKGKNLLHDSAFISLGGQMGKNQVQNILKEYPQARVNTAFDNDTAGRIYDIRTYMAAIGKEINVIRDNDGIKFHYDNNKTVTIPEDQVTLNKFKEETGIHKKFGTVYKSAEGTKDWNDELVAAKKSMQEIQVNKNSNQVKL